MTNLHPIADEGRRKLHVGAVNAINQAIDEIERREERLALEEERRFDRRYQHIKDTAARYQLRLERQLSAVNRMNGGSEKGIKLALEEVKEIIEDRNFWGSKGPLDRLLEEYPKKGAEMGYEHLMDAETRKWWVQHLRNIEGATMGVKGADVGDTGHPRAGDNPIDFSETKGMRME